jgi:hypothetical protein
MRICGRCHCGNISFSLAWEPDPEWIQARACACTFCTRHGNVWAAYPAGLLDIALRDAARVSRYRFGTRTAEFLICAACGIVPIATSRVENWLHAVVNVNTFEGVDPALLRHAAADFHDEAPAFRLARRQRNWIGRVRFVAR